MIHLSNLCTEILEVTSHRETAVCNLGSVNLRNHISYSSTHSKPFFDFQKLQKTVDKAMKYLDRVIDINFYPIEKAKDSNHRWRPVGLGVMGLQDILFQLKYPFDSPKAMALSQQIQEEIYYQALSASCDLAKNKGAHSNFKETWAAEGKLQFDLWGIQPKGIDINTNKEKWGQLKEKIQKYGLRNSLLIAIAPTATIASIVGCYEAIEPQITNLFKKETLSGEFLQINQYLIKELKKLNLWDIKMAEKIKAADGSIQEISEIPEETRNLFRTAWELPMRSIIDMAALRGPFIDQSQSLNLFIESPTIGKLSSMYMYAWKKGLKTTYYLRSRPATNIAKTTIPNTTNPTNEPQSTYKMEFTEEKDMEGSHQNNQSSQNSLATNACKLENPDPCESCQ